MNDERLADFDADTVGTTAAGLWVEAMRDFLEAGRPTPLGAWAIPYEHLPDTAIARTATALACWAQRGQGTPAEAERGLADLRRWLCRRPLLRSADPLDEFDLPKKGAESAKLIETVMIGAQGRLRIHRGEGILTRELAILTGLPLDAIYKMILREPVWTMPLDVVRGGRLGKMRLVTVESAKMLLVREGVAPWALESALVTHSSAR